MKLCSEHRPALLSVFSQQTLQPHGVIVTCVPCPGLAREAVEGKAFWEVFSLWGGEGGEIAEPWTRFSAMLAAGHEFNVDDVHLRTNDGSDMGRSVLMNFRWVVASWSNSKAACLLCAYAANGWCLAVLKPERYVYIPLPCAGQPLGTPWTSTCS